jgi:nicotinamidase-related amidase
MKDLIEALQIFLKYQDSQWPTHCSHDKLTVCVDPEVVSDEDKTKLESLGFVADNSEDCFVSYRFGNC